MQRLWISAAVIVADQVTKTVVVGQMQLGESIPVLGSFFRLTYILNPGAVFGLRLGGQALHLIFAVVALCLVGVLLYRTPSSERVAGSALALVLGGAVGNVIDRLHIGAVIDFLDFGVGGARWWIFNIADASVSVGAGLLILSYGFLHGAGTSSSGEAPATTDGTDAEVGDATGDRTGG